MDAEKNKKNYVGAIQELPEVVRKKSESREIRFRIR